MACRVSEGGTVKTYTLPICKPTVLVCDNANAQVASCARARGAVQSLSPAACKPAVQPSNAKRTEKSCRGGAGSLFGRMTGSNPHCFARRENFPLLESIKFQQTMAGQHGGRRKGAGRPLGSRNRPRLIHGLPETNDPLQWLLALMNHPGAPLRLRLRCAVVLLDYWHTRKG